MWFAGRRLCVYRAFSSPILRRLALRSADVAQRFSSDSPTSSTSAADVDEDMELDRVVREQVASTAGNAKVARVGDSPAVPFETLLRHSKFMQLGDFDGRLVIGEIVHRGEDDLYIDYGGKFNVVCRIPAVNEESYLIGAQVVLRLHDPELSERFLGAKRDLTLLEADATLIRVYQRRDDHVKREENLPPWRRRRQTIVPDVRQRLREMEDEQVARAKADREGKEVGVEGAGMKKPQGKRGDQGDAQLVGKGQDEPQRVWTRDARRSAIDRVVRGESERRDPQDEREEKAGTRRRVATKTDDDGFRQAFLPETGAPQRSRAEEDNAKSAEKRLPPWRRDGRDRARPSMQDRPGQSRDTVRETRAGEESTRKPWEKAGGGTRRGGEKAGEQQRDGDGSAARRQGGSKLTWRKPTGDGAPVKEGDPSDRGGER